jgi:predicted nuclease of predicted toxin-antitoxin system
VKVLLDACVWGGAADPVRAAGHEVEAVASWPRDPGDEDILRHAFRQAQVLITLDKDFGELAVVRE